MLMIENERRKKHTVWAQEVSPLEPLQLLPTFMVGSHLRLVLGAREVMAVLWVMGGVVMVGIVCTMCANKHNASNKHIVFPSRHCLRSGGCDRL
jgi:hypothetical protein